MHKLIITDFNFNGFFVDNELSLASLINLEQSGIIK